MTALLQRFPRRSFGEKRAVSGVEHAGSASQPDGSSSTPDAEPTTSRQPQSGGWGRNLLAAVGIPLTLVGIAIVLLPFFTRTSGLMSAAGTGILGVGVLLVVMSAFFDSTRGRVGSLLGWHVWFGRGELRDDEPAQPHPEDDHDPRADADPAGRHT